MEYRINIETGKLKMRAHRWEEVIGESELQYWRHAVHFQALLLAISRRKQNYMDRGLKSQFFWSNNPFSWRGVYTASKNFLTYWY